MKYHHPLLTALAAAALLAAVLLAPVPPARAQEGACGDTVTVVAGDTLFSIARRCGTTVSALLVANLSITNPDILYAGTVLTIPGGDDVPAEDEPQVGIRPLSGQAGVDIEVRVTNFPPDTEVELSLGIADGEYEIVDTVTTDDDGMVITEVAIPETARVGQDWVVVAATTDGELSVISPSYRVTGLPPESEGGQPIHIVQPGERLYRIGLQYGVTVDEILAVNPGITNRNLIYPGREILIPLPSGEPGDAVVTITPMQGPAGTTVRVSGSGLPPSSVVDIGIGPVDSEYEVVDTELTSSSGTLTTQVTLPGSMTPGQRWVVVVETADDVIVSNAFTVTADGGGSGRTYTVQPGDTLYRIAVRNGLTVDQLVAANPGITNPNLIYAGQVLTIP